MGARVPCATIAIAASGPHPVPPIATAYGKIRSRAGADLQYTARDAEKVFENWREADEDVPDSLRRLLIDPRLDQVESTIREVSRIIDQQFNAEFGVDLYFAGHGKHGTGNLVLRDGVLSPARFLRLQADDAEKHEDTTRTVGVMLDSCYSGAFLIRLAIDAYERYQCFRMDDSHVSCLPDEQCYELDVLGHGVFTYTTLHPGNASVDARSFGQAILDNDKSQIAKGLQGLVATMSSATAYLTEGRQCSLSLIKSSFLEVDGGFASSTLGENPDFQTAVRELTSFKIAK